jgi:hypothetical protein
MFSIEDSFWDSQTTSVSAAGRILGQVRASSQELSTRGNGFGDGLKTARLERHLWARNAPYTVPAPSNHLKPQQMRPPSERAISRSRVVRSHECTTSTRRPSYSADQRFGTALKCDRLAARTTADGWLTAIVASASSLLTTRSTQWRI